MDTTYFGPLSRFGWPIMVFGGFALMLFFGVLYFELFIAKSDGSAPPSKSLETVKRWVYDFWGLKPNGR